MSLTASDGALSSSSSVIITVNASQGGGSSAIRVNAGGSTYTDATGNVWSGDTYFNGGSTYSTTASINNTPDPRLYQTVRYGAFSYVIPMANGAATVNLKFAEPYFTSAGKRVFNVSVNGQTVLANFDVIAQAGSAYAALDRKFTTNVTNGQLTIQFTPVVDHALVNAIEILPSSTGSTGVTVSPTTVTLGAGQTAQFTAAVTGTSNGAVSWSIGAGPGTITTTGLYTAPATITTPSTATIVATSTASPAASATATVNLTQFAGIYVNSGGGNVSSGGLTWGADNGFTGGSTYTNPSPVAGTTIPALYETLRYGSTFSYQFAVPNGVRTVKLRFAETFFTQRGSRVFNVAINGQTVLSNFDIVAAAGAAETATDRQFNVTVVDGKLNIDFTSISNYAQVNAIDIQ